jgi:hypothetical protein
VPVAERPGCTPDPGVEVSGHDQLQSEVRSGVSRLTSRELDVLTDSV